MRSNRIAPSFPRAPFHRDVPLSVYNAINQLTSTTDGTNTLASYAMMGWRETSTTFQSGATATKPYTGFRSEVASVHHQTNAPATFLRLDYGYNEVHRGGTFRLQIRSSERWEITAAGATLLRQFLSVMSSRIDSPA